LNNAHGLQTAGKTFVHQAIVKRRVFVMVVALDNPAAARKQPVIRLFDWLVGIVIERLR
jgi:hypothetical protein